MESKSHRKENSELVRIALLGDERVGKTSILSRFFEEEIHAYFRKIEITFRRKQLIINEKPVPALIDDRLSCDKFRPRLEYLKSMNGFLVVYSCDNIKSFEKVNFWIKQIPYYPEIKKCVVLIGNKKDHRNREVTYEEGKAIADKYEIKFFETSAEMQYDKCIEEAFYTLSSDIIETLDPKIKSMEVNKQLNLSKSRSISHRSNCF